MWKVINTSKQFREFLDNLKRIRKEINIETIKGR